jgi:hypothetical protein
VTVRHAGAALIAAAASMILVPASALAATPAENAAFARQMAVKINPVFAREAPDLALGQVSCALPLDGTVVHCVAHFTDLVTQVRVVYTITARLTDAGKLTWTASPDGCRSALSGRKVAC